MGCLVTKLSALFDFGFRIQNQNEANCVYFQANWVISKQTRLFKRVISKVNFET